MDKLESRVNTLVRVLTGTFSRPEKSASALASAESYVSRTANSTPSRMAALVLANPSTISGHAFGSAKPIRRKATKAA